MAGAELGTEMHWVSAEPLEGQKESKLCSLPAVSGLETVPHPNGYLRGLQRPKS